jgi:hypothetical protein
MDPVMMRLAVLSIVAVMLAACSGSSRVDGVVPGWANPSPQDAYGNRQLRGAPNAPAQGAPQQQGRESED